MKINTNEVTKLLDGYAKFDPEKLLKIGQKLLLQEIKKRAPKKTGEYAESFKAKKVTSERAIIETDQGFLHILLEYQGSKPHVIVPRKATVLSWVQDGQRHFAMKVNHPGFQAIPHVRPAIKKILPIWQKKIIEVLDGEKN